jgi:hypothetical protein
MKKTKSQIFAEKQQELPDSELIELADKEISKLAKTGGRSHTMCVPPKVTDTDMLLSELLRRFKELSNAINNMSEAGKAGAEAGEKLKNKIKSINGGGNYD